jgi:hypothetical protein
MDLARWGQCETVIQRPVFPPEYECCRVFGKGREMVKDLAAPWQ